MGLGYNKKSLRNLNPSKVVVWNSRQFKSFAEMSNITGFPRSTIQDRFHSDKPIKGHYIDEL